MGNQRERSEVRAAALTSLGVLLAALLACGGKQGATAPPRAPQRAVQTPARAAGCASDYQCQYGQKCVKDSLSFEGVCAQPVTSYGVPVYQPPSPNSLQPGTGECSFDTECTIGFRCVKSSGGLYGNCLR